MSLSSVAHHLLTNLCFFVCTTLFGIACGFDMQIALNVLILQTFYLQFSLLERTQSINLCSQNLDSTYSENMFQAALSFRSALGTWWTQLVANIAITQNSDLHTPWDNAPIAWTDSNHVECYVVSNFWYHEFHKHISNNDYTALH